MSFKDWLFGNGGTAGNYDYTAIHFISVAIIVAIAILIGLFGFLKSFSPKFKKFVLYFIAVFQLMFEIGWRIVYLIRGDDLLSLLPFYPCNLNGILIPLAVLLGNKSMKEMFYVFGFVGGILTFAMPQGIFSNSVLIFPILKSLLQHTALIFIPVLEYTSGSFRPQLNKYWLAIIGMLIHVVNGVGIARLCGYTTDFLYFNSGMPFVVEGIPGWVVVSCTAIIVVAVLYLLLAIPDFVKSKNAKKDNN